MMRSYALVGVGFSCLSWLAGCSGSEENTPVGGSGAGQGGSGAVVGGQGGRAGAVVGAADAAPVMNDALADAVAQDVLVGDTAIRDAAPADDQAREAGAVTGTIVPLYTDPGDTSWNAIVASKKSHPGVPVVAIVNPSSGPGNRVDASYTTGIDRLLAAGVVPIGYVSTSYTDRGEPAVKTDIDQWLTFYPKIQGIFFDEQSNDANGVVFYRDVAGYAKGKGLALTVGNPGTSVPVSYLDTVDVMLIYEAAGLPALQRLAGYSAQRAHYAIIPYAAALDTAFVAAAKADVGYVYATSDTLPNPWDTLSPYFDQLLDGLSR